MSFSCNNLKSSPLRISALLSVAVLGAFGCTEPVDPTPVAAVAFRILADSVLPTKTYQLQLVALSVTGVEVTGRNARYESLFPEFASVDQKGLVTPKAPGNAVIRATLDGRSATAAVKVLDRVTRIVISPATDQITISGQRTLTVAVTGANGQAIGGRLIQFRSSNPGVASVSPAGVVTGIALGTTTITAESPLDSVSATSTVSVITPPVASVELSPPGTQILRIGSTLQMRATPLDANNAAISGKTATWTSNNPQVANVTSAGLVTTVALGTVAITATIDNRSASVPIQVTEVPAKSVRLSPDTIAMLSATSRQLVPDVIDSVNRAITNLATHTVLWSSTNAAVANVSPSGFVTAISAGTTRISLTVDNVRSNDIVIAVTDQVTSIRLTPFLPQIIRLGGTLQVTAQPLNSQNQPINGKTINWSTSNPSVATVSPTGTITSVALGNATITAEVDQRTASLGVTVTPVPLQSVTLAPATDTLAGGENKLYTPVMVDTAGRTVTSTVGRTLVWNSSNPLVAGVSNGVVSGFGQNGTSNISVTIDNVASNNVALTVAQIVQLTVSPNPAAVQVGKTTALTVTAKDVAGNTIKTTRTPFFQVVNTMFATVSPAGVLTGVAVGTTQISIQLSNLGGVFLSVPLTVNP